ncbi:S41 family peptidase [Gelidibacter sp.]|uniref:S41 family peptidase n=1 Tax=Gelidibacter sp. TaxID=2018083 RepID=UPI002C9B04B9|nr:S41 family peptidase [Gelidibacter sp.]HUH26783.1 S41 family peptidase [Gelidibacter sp.]
MLKKLALIAFSFIISLSNAQEDAVFCKQINALNRRVQEFHFRPKPLNDGLSKAVFKLFLDRLDENKQFFKQSDLLLFQSDEFQLDDAIASNDCSFVEKYSATLQQRIEASKNYIATLKDETFDYSGKDTLYFKAEPNSGYFKDDLAFKKYWNKRIRYVILDHLVEQDSTFSYLEDNFKTLEAEAKPKIIENQLCLLDELLHKNGGMTVFAQESFLNAFANYQDPNSFFYNDSDKSQFEDSVSNHQLTFGIDTAKNKNGDIVIAYIAPGSAAFLNGNFEENDVIKSLTSPTQTLETFCVSNEDILAFTANEKNETLIFKIKKQNGAIQDIPLTKTELKVEQNSCTAFIIKEKSNFAYLNIPSFYTDFDSPDGNGLARDVANQLQILEKENVKGLIIDLRFNGGGSMKEAAELSGLFINKGPLAILKYGNGDMFTITDDFKGTLFNKPMVILIDNFSASASEFFAGVMQDYNRAIIVGSPSHGKASAQVILPLDDTDDIGFCKLTIEKFYRVTGKSHQSVGIVPDIILPSLYDGFKTNEIHSLFSLSNDAITPAFRYSSYRKLPLSELQSKSKIRVDRNESFKAIKNINKSMLTNYIDRDLSYALTLKNIYEDVQNYNTLWTNLYQKLDLATKKVAVKNTSPTKNKLSGNDLELNQSLIEDISTDIYIQEALAILSDAHKAKLR